ncbi:MAG: hypothetical protein WED33_07915 [Bacteroidia bacterium]
MLRALLATIAFVSFLTKDLQSQRISSDSLELCINKMLSFIASEQVNHTIEGHQYKGEWPAMIRLRTGFLLLHNPGYDIYDSNCFSLAGIHNTLATTFLIRPDLLTIPDMLENAIPRLMSYYSNGGFNFWPLLPPGGRLYMFHRNKQEGFVRRPVQYKLYSPYIRKAANVVNDNDDTSQGLLALLLYSKVQRKMGIENNFGLELSPLLTFWRDTNRLSQHWYNIIHFDKRESGAFLTWRAQETPFPAWNIPRLLLNNATFLLPYSTLYPKAFTPYIPYGCNDVDAVVNANMLTALAENNEYNAVGIKESIRFIERKIKRKKWSRAGIYYPNRYNLHYSVLKACRSGIEGLKPSADKLIKHILKTSSKQGAFESRRIVNKKDIEQSSIYALHAMLQYGNPYENGTSEQVENTIRFLIGRLRNHNNSICLDGGIFFSGGTVIRNTMYWKSDAYSTALFLECLVLYQEYLKEKETFGKASGKSP